MLCFKLVKNFGELCSFGLQGLFFSHGNDHSDYTFCAPAARCIFPIDMHETSIITL